MILDFPSDNPKSEINSNPKSSKISIFDSIQKRSIHPEAKTTILASGQNGYFSLQSKMASLASAKIDQMSLLNILSWCRDIIWNDQIEIWLISLSSDSSVFWEFSNRLNYQSVAMESIFAFQSKFMVCTRLTWS